MKLTRKQKILIGKLIKKHQMKRAKVLLNSQMVAIPETEDESGKPLFIPVVQYNKIWDRAFK